MRCCIQNLLGFSLYLIVLRFSTCICSNLWTPQILGVENHKDPPTMYSKLVSQLQDIQNSSTSVSSDQGSAHLHKRLGNGNAAIGSKSFGASASDKLAKSASPTGPARASSFGSSHLAIQRKLFAESQIGRSSFQKLLEPSLLERPGIAPYRVVLGKIKQKVPSFSFFLFFISVKDLDMRVQSVKYSNQHWFCGVNYGTLNSFSLRFENFLIVLSFLRLFGHPQIHELGYI